MSKILNGFNELVNKFRDLNNRFDTFRFGLKLISQKRLNFYYKVVLFSTSTLTTGIYLSMNTVFLDKYKSVVHMYSSGDLKLLDPSIESLAKSVCNEFNQKSSDLITFFPSVGSEPISAGSLDLMTGAFIGCPHNLLYNTFDDVKTIDMKFIGEHNPYMRWRSPAGKAFLESLVLSENAKKFAIGRHLYLTDNFNLLLNCLNVWFSTIVGIGFAQEVFKRTSFPKQLNLRLFVRIISLLIGLYIWSVINQFINYYSGLRADLKTISVANDYLDAAIEYYSKMLTRNASLYELLDQRGKSLYTEDGEFKGLLSSHLLTLSRRLRYLNQLKQSIDVSNNGNESKI